MGKLWEMMNKQWQNDNKNDENWWQNRWTQYINILWNEHPQKHLCLCTPPDFCAHSTLTVCICPQMPQIPTFSTLNLDGSSSPPPAPPPPSPPCPFICWDDCETTTTVGTVESVLFSTMNIEHYGCVYCDQEGSGKRKKCNWSLGAPQITPDASVYTGLIAQKWMGWKSH